MHSPKHLQTTISVVWSSRPLGYVVACALTACLAAIQDVNFVHFAFRAEQKLCNIAWQLEPALPTLTCYLPSVSSSSAITRVSMADLVVFFDGSWSLLFFCGFLRRSVGGLRFV